MEISTLAWLLLLLPLAVAAIILLGLQRSAGTSALLATGSAIATFVIAFAVSRFPGAEVSALPWIHIGELHIDIGLRVDKLSGGMMLIVTGIGALVHLFSLGYMREDPGKARYFGGLSLFMFSMTGIVLSDNFVMMFVFWELVGVSSYLLIGHWYKKDSAADAANKAFLTNRIGDFGFMIGILLVWILTGSISFSGIEEALGGGATPALLDLAVICIFCGAIGKSAQVPLHVWLPDAMEGPTPVSALIHAATMVAAGVFMLARVSFLIDAAELAATFIVWTGAITALFAALMAISQNDIKRVLAYSTLSQLGYMIMAQGIAGGSDAGMFHLYTHAFFKALLFLGAGAVIHACHHEQDIWKMGGLRERMPNTFYAFAAGTAALIAVPGTSGFFSKEEILHAAHDQHLTIPWLIGLFVAFLTSFYMTRLFVVTFLGKARSEEAGHAKEVETLMWIPLAILGVLALISAYFPVSKLLFSATSYAHLPKFDLTLLGSLVALVAGVGLGFVLYRGRESDPLNIPVFAKRFYIDEIYRELINVFQDAVARFCDFLDKYVVDPVTARLPAFSSLAAGSILRGFQAGNIQAYVFLFGLSVVLLLLLVIL